MPPAPSPVATENEQFPPRPVISPSSPAKAPSRESKIPISTSTSENLKKSNPRQIIEERKAREKQQEIDNLTFKPKIAVSSTKKIEVKGGLLERTKADLEKRKEARTARATSDVPTFKPTLIPYAKQTDIPGRHATPTRKKEVVIEEPSFRPEISKKASTIKRTTFGVPIGERLYKHGSETKVKVDMMKLAREQDEARDCTFTPQIIETPFKKEESQVSFVERMEQYAAERDKKQAEKKAAADEVLKKAATFKPQIKFANFTPSLESAGARVGSAKARDSAVGVTDVFTRLASATTGDKMKSEIEDDSSIPNLNVPNLRGPASAGPKSMPSEPVYERIMKVAAEKKAEFEKEAKKILEEREKEMTFAPNVPKQSTSFTTSNDGKEKADARQSNDVVDRLLGSTKSKTDADKLKEEQELSGCTFQPNTGTTYTDDSSEPVYMRLQRDAEEQRKKEREAHMTKLAREMKGVTFAPNIPVNPDIEIKYQGENKDVIRRLSTTTPAKIEDNKMQKVKDEMDLKECTFAPSLPKASIEMAKQKLETKDMERTGTGTGTGTKANRISFAAQPQSSAAENPSSFNAKKCILSNNTTASVRVTTAATKKSVTSNNAKSPHEPSTPTFAKATKSSSLLFVRNAEGKALPIKDDKTGKAKETAPLIAKNSIKESISKADFANLCKELKSMQKYPLSIRIVVESLLCILCIPVDKARCESTEHIFRRLVVKGGVFERLMVVEFTPEVYERMRLFRENAMYRPHLVNKSSSLASSLCAWILKELDETAAQYNIMSPLRGSKDFSPRRSTDSVGGDTMVSLQLNDKNADADAESLSKSSTLNSEDLTTGQAISESISFMDMDSTDENSNPTTISGQLYVDLPNQVQPYVDKISPKKRGPVQVTGNAES